MNHWIGITDDDNLANPELFDKLLPVALQTDVGVISMTAKDHEEIPTHQFSIYRIGKAMIAVEIDWIRKTIMVAEHAPDQEST